MCACATSCTLLIGKAFDGSLYPNHLPVNMRKLNLDVINSKLHPVLLPPAIMSVINTKLVLGRLVELAPRCAQSV